MKTKISQREAQRMRKRLRTMSSELGTLQNSYLEPEGGVHLYSINIGDACRDSLNVAARLRVGLKAIVSGSQLKIFGVKNGV